MSQYRKKPVVIEAITFDELVAYGLSHGANIVRGMPWSFDYNGHRVTHENDECYLIPTLEGTMRMDRGDMLITGVKGELYPCKLDIFAATYEPANAPPRAPVAAGEAITLSSASFQALLEAYILAYKRGDAPMGDCKTLLDTLVADAVAGERGET